jgi:uncharacterized protein with NRDE domain
MCLLVFAWRVHPEYPLILAGNRDEFHGRPAAAAHWWKEPDGILAGKDLQAGGSWLGLNRAGRFAVVTNYREPGVATSGKRSRGELVSGFLGSTASAADWMDRMGGQEDDYGGFNLVIGADEEAHYLTNRGDDRRNLKPGIYGLSNHRLDTPWPKVVAVREELARLIEHDRVDTNALIELLADRALAPDDELPHTGVPLDWERALSAAFIAGAEYGTRASTVVVMKPDGITEFVERRFGPGGDPAGESRFVVSR